MSAWAKIGGQCVCVEAGWTAEESANGRIPTHVPEVDQVLTIVDIRQPLEDGALYLRFAEISDAGSDGGWFWHIENFRPVTPIEKDLAMFEAIARGAVAPVELEAV